MAGLMVAGTASDAGKSLVVTALCRSFARRGIRVAPFKAQNMSNNSMVCRDGSEIGRAQYLQAQAAGVEPASWHNPVLLKPGSDRQAFVIVRGQPAGQLRAGEYATGRQHLADAAFEAYDELSETVDLVICEGAGSPAEINLRGGDYVNMGLARRFGLPVVVVGDIDRGGILASLYGTWALLDSGDRELIKAFIINKFRGDESVLAPGLDMITARTGVPFAGVLPWLNEVWIDAEDTLAVAQWPRQESLASNPLTVAVVQLPRTSNATDVEALAAEPGVDVRVTRSLDVCRDADLLVIPGSRATVSDLGWLRDSGVAAVAIDRARSGRPILGICGGYQMLAKTIDDTVESGAGLVDGLGLLDVEVTFADTKTLARPHTQWRGHPVDGYEIHHGVVTDDASFPGGTVSGSTWGTIWHGVLESDDFRRAWLTEIAAQAGRDWHADPTAPSFQSRREAMIELLADAADEHLDVDQLVGLASPGSL